jgi:hypothetical protein
MDKINNRNRINEIKTYTFKNLKIRHALSIDSIKTKTAKYFIYQSLIL